MKLTTRFPKLFPPFNLEAIRQYTLGLVLMSAAQLLLFGYYALSFFYEGHILLKVHVWTLANSQPHLSRTIESPVGTYLTGNEGELLYRVSSPGEALLFFNLGDLTVVDVLFLFGISWYLHRTMSKLRPGREFSAGVGETFTVVGLLAMLMFVVKMGFNTGIAQLFQARTHQLFAVDIRTGGGLYMILGLVLLICGMFFRQGVVLQQESEMTI